MIKLVRRLVILLALVVAAIVVCVIVGKPYLERIAGKAITEQFGGPNVTVKLETPHGLGVLSGEIGDVTVSSEPFVREKLQLQSASATYRDAKVSYPSVLDRSFALKYSSVSFSVSTGLPAIQAFLREQLRLRGLPGASNARVLFRPNTLLVVSGALRMRAALKVVAPDIVRIVPLDGSPAVRRALASRIQLGPLPDGVSLKGVRLKDASAILTGGGPAGRITVRR